MANSLVASTSNNKEAIVESFGEGSHRLHFQTGDGVRHDVLVGGGNGDEISEHIEDTITAAVKIRGQSVVLEFDK